MQGTDSVLSLVRNRARKLSQGSGILREGFPEKGQSKPLCDKGERVGFTQNRAEAVLAEKSLYKGLEVPGK